MLKTGMITKLHPMNYIWTRNSPLNDTNWIINNTLTGFIWNLSRFRFQRMNESKKNWLDAYPALVPTWSINLSRQRIFHYQFLFLFTRKNPRKTGKLAAIPTALRDCWEKLTHTHTISGIAWGTVEIGLNVVFIFPFKGASIYAYYIHIYICILSN